MLKKALLGTGVLMLTGAFVFGKDMFTYVRTWGSNVREAVKAEVPIEFEVDRAKNMVETIVPDIRDCMHKIAEQQVDIEHRTREINQRGEEMATQKQAILTLRADLSSGNGPFKYASRTYTADQVKQDLAVRFNRFKAAEESLSQDRQILAAREKTLKANEEKLDTLLASKKQLEVQIEQLEARVKTVQAAQAASELEFDDSRLARAKKLIGDLNKQLDVRVKMLDAEGKFTELIPVEESKKPNVDNVTEQIDSYFGPEKESGVPTAAIVDQPAPAL